MCPSPEIVPNFPKIDKSEQSDANPAIQLYGRRFYKDQTEIEYLVEFLLVAGSEKKIGEELRLHGAENNSWQCFPDNQTLLNWPENTPLTYYPKMHLILKLFAFLGSSDLETRHKCHLKRFKELVSDLKPKIESSLSKNKDDIISVLEKVLAGFIGIGGNRTWCTHSFLPIATELLAGETIWQKSQGARDQTITWEQAVKQSMFKPNSHDFLARGGEVLYLQLCNIFRLADTPEVISFENKMGFNPGTAVSLKSKLEKGLKHVLASSSGTSLNTLANWIEKSADTLTAQKTEKRPAVCAWCPEESWPEAFLFAWEMTNICDALLDPIERIEMLKLSCIFQTLRSLSAQSTRYWYSLNKETKALGGIGGYAWIVTQADTSDRALKESAKRNLIRIQEMMHGAIRTRAIQELGKKGQGVFSYKEGDKQAQELFVKLGKKIEFIAPYKGPGARFVMTDTLLRYFVLALIPPGKRMTLSSFRERLYQHYGIALNGKQLNLATRWTYDGQEINRATYAKKWLDEKLRALGFLVPLSDDVSIVENPFSEKSINE